MADESFLVLPGPLACRRGGTIFCALPSLWEAELAGQMVITTPDADVADDKTREEPSKRFQNVTISCKERRPLTSIPPMATVGQS